MNILITGGSGFIGTNLIKTLKKQKPEAKLFVIDNYSTGYDHNKQEGVEYYNHNIEDPSATGKMEDIKPDIIYHLAALARIQHLLNTLILHLIQILKEHKEY